MLLPEFNRPYFHFTPPDKWMNDPNGLVFYDGEYHLFYQYHPDGVEWGPMHWGHAVSQDLVTWSHLPIALYPDKNGTIFSGSAIVDWQNTADWGKETLVAVFTHGRDQDQRQSLAYSTDRGRTFTKYCGNPVLQAPKDQHNFRDPKVFWFGEKENGYWVMVVAAGNEIHFYVSHNLRTWNLSGVFNNGIVDTSNIWETPDLFELSIDGRSEKRWVLTVGVLGNVLSGRSGMQYYIGHFDGRSFQNENGDGTILWLDHGADYYAAQSWNEIPDGRRIMLGWMNNWQYANVVPSTTWRGMFSLPRELSLRETSEGLRVYQQPISELNRLREKNIHWENEKLLADENLFTGIRSDSFEIIAEFQVIESGNDFGFRVRVGKDEVTTIGYYPRLHKLFVDRNQSGRSDFDPAFADIHSTRLDLDGDRLRLHIFVDRMSVEVFANDGRVTMSDCVFPSDDSLGIELYNHGCDVCMISMDYFELKKGIL